MAIRPEVQALITRGHVQVDEVSQLNCSQEEATALIPALTNIALAMRISRCVANTPKWTPPMPGFQLRALMMEAKLRLEEVPAALPQYSNQELGDHIRGILDGAIFTVNGKNVSYPVPGDPACVGYVELLFVLGDNVALRLEGGF